MIYLKDSDIIILKCSTVPGFVWPADFEKSTQAINNIKNRTEEKKYQYLVKDISTALKYWEIKKIDPELEKEWENNQLTLIIHDIGIRKEPYLNYLSNEYDLFHATSINESGQKSLTNINDIEEFIKKHQENYRFVVVWNDLMISSNQPSKVKKINNTGLIEILR